MPRRDCAREPGRQLLLRAQLVWHRARREGLHGAVRQARLVGDGGVRIQLVGRPPHAADGEDDDLPHPLVQRGVCLLGILQVQERRGDAGAEQDRG